MEKTMVQQIGKGSLVKATTNAGYPSTVHK